MVRGDPSFSSSLLDSIYRSIDRPVSAEPETRKPGSQFGRYRKEPAVTEKQSFGPRRISVSSYTETDSCFRVPNPKRVLSENRERDCGKSSDGLVKMKQRVAGEAAKPKQRVSVSSSSETDSCFRVPNPKRVLSENRERDCGKSPDGFAKSKQIVAGEAPTLKQSVSPARRISGFLAGVFGSGNGRRVRLCSVSAVEDVNFDCRSKTPRKGNNGAKRTVVSKKEVEKQRFNGGMGREFSNRKMNETSDSDEEDDDATSCASSDLFELDHLIGQFGRYMEELPMYKSTRLRIVRNI